jgi:hypothetical protein
MQQVGLWSGGQERSGDKPANGPSSSQCGRDEVGLPGPKGPGAIEVGGSQRSKEGTDVRIAAGAPSQPGGERSAARPSDAPVDREVSLRHPRGARRALPGLPAARERASAATRGSRAHNAAPRGSERTSRGLPDRAGREARRLAREATPEARRPSRARAGDRRPDDAAPTQERHTSDLHRARVPRARGRRPRALQRRRARAPRRSRPPLARPRPRARRRPPRGRRARVRGQADRAPAPDRHRLHPSLVVQRGALLRPRRAGRPPAHDPGARRSPVAGAHHDVRPPHARPSRRVMARSRDRRTRARPERAAAASSCARSR